MQQSDSDVHLYFISGGSEAPTVRIDPRYLQVNEGDSIEFNCIATGLPLPRLEWVRDGGELSRESSFQVSSQSCSIIVFVLF